MNPHPPIALQKVNELASVDVPGAFSLAEKTRDAQKKVNAALLKLNDLLTECSAISFVRDHLQYEIIRIENDGDVVSPHVLIKSESDKPKSCDILCRDSTGELIYVETKCSTTDCIKNLFSGPQGFSPQNRIQVQRWIAGWVFDCIEKGANLLIARIVTYPSSVDCGPSTPEDINFEIFTDRKIVEEIPISISVDIPNHFKGVWFIKQGTENFYRVRRKEE